jgi:hypothetical protein
MTRVSGKDVARTLRLLLIDALLLAGVASMGLLVAGFTDDGAAGITVIALGAYALGRTAR